MLKFKLPVLDVFTPHSTLSPNRQFYRWLAEQLYKSDLFYTFFSSREGNKTLWGLPIGYKFNVECVYMNSVDVATFRDKSRIWFSKHSTYNTQRSLNVTMQHYTRHYGFQVDNTIEQGYVVLKDQFIQRV